MKVVFSARYWWLTPVILATQKAEIRRIIIRSQPLANSLRDPVSKIPIHKRAGGMAQGVDPEFKPQYRKNNKTFCFISCLLFLSHFPSALQELPGINS
jgi:hypothetical protein